MLKIKDLKTYYKMGGEYVQAVDSISFTLQEGENLGLVGESGCGKTTAAKSIIRLLSSNASIQGGEILFKGQDITKMSLEELNKLRWEEISMVSQSAMNALDPVYRVGDQIVEAIKIHRDVSNQDAMDRAGELFLLVGLEQKRLQAYPHELSGGMKQRVVIAMAMALDPSLIIADEPTTALDVVVQDGILRQLALLKEQLHNSIILVTHDISVVAETCERIVVMYGGKIMEWGDTKDVLREPIHPYTMGLKNAFPTLEEAREELISIPGSPPQLINPPPGCRFIERCPFSQKECQEDPRGEEVETGHMVYCHFPEKAEEFRQRAGDPSLWRTSSSIGERVDRVKSEVVLEGRDLHRLFPIKRKLKDIIKRRPGKNVHAVDGISLEVHSQEILGLAGESGSGKSTLGEILCHLQETTRGEFTYKGQEVSKLRGKELKEFRRDFQMVFQDPYETLNPRFTVLNTIMEPLKIHKIGQGEEERLELVKKALMRAELNPPHDYLLKYPHQLSGGQRQRVALARAIVLEPTFIIADEPVSMLDVSIRAGVLNLLRSFRDDLGISIIYVSHDLATIRYICDRIAILYLGRILEIGPTERVITNPSHPYTKLLINSVPRVEGEREGQLVEGEIPDPIDLPNGCRFHPRCLVATPDCGWEGRDLVQFLTKKKEDLSLQGRLPPYLEAIKDLDLKGLHGCIYVEEGREKEVREGILACLEEERPSLRKGILGIEEEPGGLIFSFDALMDFPLKDLGEGHQSACPFSEA